jgi:hypothetical protein
MSKLNLQGMIDYLWPEGERLGAPQVRMVLDGARHPDISRLVRSGNLDYEFLFGGPLSPRLQAAAPYIVRLEFDSPLAHTLLERSWSQHWGILTIAHPYISTRQQCTHLKKLLRVVDEAGTEMGFRFYDPRVLRAFLPTCTDAEATRFFGPITSIVAQSEEQDSVVRFTHAMPGIDIKVAQINRQSTLTLA